MNDENAANRWLGTNRNVRTVMEWFDEQDKPAMGATVRGLLREAFLAGVARQQGKLHLWPIDVQHKMKKRLHP
jgi:hypothetical protein